MLYEVKLFCLLIIFIAVSAYPKWSYKKFDERSKINSKHPDWKPYCATNFLEKDPQWFIDNGYAEYVKEYVK